MISNPYSITYIASALFSLGLMSYVFIRRKEGMSSYIYLLLTCTTIWSLFYGLELGSAARADIKFYLQMEYIGISLLPVFYLFYILNYTGIEKYLNKSVYPFFFVIPLVTIAMVISNEAHYLFYAESTFKTLGRYYYHAFVPGPFYYIHVVYSYTLIAAGIVMLLKTYKGQIKRQRSNILILLSGTVVPFFTSIAYILNFRPEGFIDLTPLGFLLMSAILAYGAVNNKLFEMTPIVLNYLYEIIPDAIFILDRHSNIINTNPSALKLLKSGILDECLKDENCLHYEELPDVEETHNKEVKVSDKYFYITKKAVTEGKNKQIGLMLIVKDVTEIKNLEHMQELLMSIALNFINTPLDDYEKTVYVSLERMGRYVNAERVYVVSYNYDKGMINLTHEWCRQGVRSIFEEVQNINLDAIKDLVEMHQKRESFFIEDMKVLFEGSPLYESLKFDKEKSFLAIPMLEGSRLIGFLGFDWLYKNHKYSLKEQQLLQLFAEILVNLISRKKVNYIIKQQAEVERITAEVTSDFVRANAQNIQEVITKTLEKLGRFLQVDSAFMLEFDKDESQIREWSLVPGNKPKFIELEKHTWLRGQISKGVLSINKIEELPHEAEAERNDFMALGIKSMISIAIKKNNQIVGVLGFQVFSQYRIWSDEDANLLKIFSNIIGEAIFKVEREKELIQAKNIAVAANKAKSEFLSNTSHEIRTPLNGMIGFTELLRNTKLNKVQLEYVENAIMSANTLMAVINDILDFSKIESGKLELDIVHTNIVQLVEKSSDIVKIMASQKGLELLLNIQPDTPSYAYVDPIRLKQIMVNLLSNAVKFTSRGEVEICLKFKALDESLGQFTIAVRDTGIGIRDEDKSKLFKAFSQADSSITRRYGGTGLGLIISNSLAEKMGSKINFTSQYGKGSVFSMTFECRYERKSTEDSTGTFPIKRVLIVDDNANNRKILEHNFMYWGLDFSSVESAEAGLALLEKDPDYDVVLIDYNMPDMDGLTAVEKIREKKLLNSQKQAVILLHSSSEDQLINEAARKLQIRQTMTKPLKASDLLFYLRNMSLNNPSVDVLKVPESSVIREKPADFSKQFCILVAEDVKMNMMLVVQLIRKRFPNARILEASNGKEVLALLENNLPDLILMDVQMPVMDGLDACRYIRTHDNPKIRSLPVIALTAGVSRSEQDLCKMAGMSDFISKPIDKKVLYQTMLKHAASAIGEQLNEAEDKEKEKPLDVSLHFNKNNLIDKILNDKDLYKQLMSQSLKEFEKDVHELIENINAREPDKIKSAAHRLKGSAFNMEFTRLGSLARVVEQNATDAVLLKSESQKLRSEWLTLKEIITNEV